MIDLHYIPTVNGNKIAIMLEETGLEYRLVYHDMGAGDLLTPEFLALNPNNKVPVIVDYDPADGGEPVTIFESGAILLYLAEKTGRFMPTDFRRREAARQWLIWQVANVGPMHGQANHFLRYAPERLDYPTKRFVNEARRQVAVMESRLGKVDYLAEEYSIADIACWPFIAVVGIMGIELADYPAVERWTKAIAERPAVRRVTEGAKTSIPAAVLASNRKLTDEQWSNVFGDKLWSAVGKGGIAAA